MVNQKGPIGIFLDRDGTIVEEKEYLSRPEQLVLLPHAAEAIKLFNQKGLPVLVVTNQSGVARGFFSEETVQKINYALAETLHATEAVVDRWYYCPHHPKYGDERYRQQCSCRKPNIGMLEQGARDFNLDLARSYMVGDSLSDLEAARNAGTKAILVLSGYGETTREALKHNTADTKAHFVASDLLAAARWITQDMEMHHEDPHR